jgi:hypothetical protein
VDNIEQEIQAKGLTAPRVTPVQIHETIKGEYYFLASDGVEAADREQCNDLMHWQSMRLMTFCVLVLANGFTVTGESACASPDNFDADLGRKIARANAVNKIWPLEGYLLKQRLSETSES